jgi:hypothetical protein
MRKLVVTTFVLAAMLCLASSGLALEKKAVRYDADGSDDWNAGATCVTAYYNICTGWVWVFGFDDATVVNDLSQIGVAATNCCGSGEVSSLLQTRIRYWSGSPSGYGFTGTIATFAADVNGCPVGAAIESQAFLPPYVPGGNAFYTQNWSGTNVLPNAHVVAVTFPGDTAPGGINPLGFGTDFGTVGPTGPDACGTCFPTGRQSHTYLWQDSGGSYCPGLTFLSQSCEVELLWDLSYACNVSVEESSWGSIKGLYR